MKDAEIVALYWQRDERAIAETAARYAAYLTKIACNITADAEDSRECVNDTYLAAWNSMPEQWPNVLSTYLGRIARQIAIDRLRRRTSQKRGASEYALSLAEMEDCIPDRRTPETALEARELDTAINDFVRSLPETAQRVFIGRYYFFDPVKTIASYCGISEANVKTTLYRSRQKLKAHLGKAGFKL